MTLTRSLSFLFVSCALAFGCSNGSTADAGADTGTPSDVTTATDSPIGANDVTTPPADAGPDPCAANTTCDSCGNASLCGWCIGTGRCMSGTAVAGSDDGTCTGVNWAGSANACPGTGICGRNTACGACAMALGCGWCTGGTPHCTTGNATSSTEGSCSGSNWIFSASMCP